MARATVYRILTRLYAYPEGEILSWIRDVAWIDVLREALALNRIGRTGLGLPSAERLIRHTPADQLALQLTREYTRLFISGVPRTVAPPYGSVYMEENGLLFGQTTAEVSRYYQSNGLELLSDDGDLPDHIVHECEFMALLVDREARGDMTKRSAAAAQAGFFHGFMLPWIPSFTERVIKGTSSPLYRMLARVTARFLAAEQEHLPAERATMFRFQRRSVSEGANKSY